MSFLGGQDLASRLTREEIILDDEGINSYMPSKIKQCSYELSLGDRVYLTDNESKTSILLDDKNDSININPGQFALLMTDETIKIPKDLLGFISIKATEKLKGLINVSGFHVDPGFEGKLLFSVYNASPSTIQLRKGEQYFLIWFSELKNPLKDEYLYKSKNHQGQKNIDPKYITPLINSDAILPFELGKKIKENKQYIEKVEMSKNLRYEKVFWICTFILGLVSTLNFTYFNKSNQYKLGYTEGYEAKIDKEVKIRIDSTISKFVNDSLSLYLKDKIENKDSLKDGTKTSK